MEPLIITAAITGASTVPSLNPNLPITPQEIADSAIQAAQAGASIVHIHARDPETGRPSSDINVFKNIITLIKEKSDVVICLTTGGSAAMTVEERMKVIPTFKPEMCSFNMGSINFALHGTLKRIQNFRFDWERPYLEASKDFVFKNTLSCEVLRRLWLLRMTTENRTCAMGEGGSPSYFYFGASISSGFNYVFRNL